MRYIAVLDTKINDNIEAMSIGIVIADAQSFSSKDEKYYIFDPEYKVGSFFFSDTVRPIIQQNHTTVGVGGFEARDKNGMLRKGFKGVLEMPAERGKRVAETAELIKNILT